MLYVFVSRVPVALHFPVFEDLSICLNESDHMVQPEATEVEGNNQHGFSSYNCSLEHTRMEAVCGRGNKKVI